MNAPPRTGGYSPYFTGSPSFGTQSPAFYDKGRLLIEEGREDVEKTGKVYVRRGGYLIAYGAVMLGLALLNLFIGPTEFLMFLTVFLTVFGLFSVFSGATLMAMSKRVKPVRIYENGIEGTAMLGTKTFFFPFTQVTSVTEARDSIDGQVYMFRIANPTQSIAIRKRTRDFQKMIEVIRAKVGQTPSAVKWDVTPEGGVTSRRVEYALYATAAVVGIAISVMFILFVFPGQPESLMIAGLRMVMPIFIILAVTYMTYRMMGMQKHVPRRLNVKVPAVIIIVTMALSLISVGLEASASEPSIAHVPISLEPKPTSSSLSPGTYTNATLSVDSWILVDTGQVLRLVNTTLTMNLSSDKGFGIWVANGGTLSITRGSRVLSSNSAFGYTFEINGTAVIDNSWISGVWGNPNQVNFDGGLEIYSSDVIVNATVFPDVDINGILIMYANPTITNSTITNAGDDGIEMHGSDSRVIGNSIENCMYAMIVADGSDALIERNYIKDNFHGIALQSSDPVIRSNVFEHNRNYAISYDSASHMVLEDNTFDGNQVDTVESSGLYILAACQVVTMGLAGGCIAILYWIQKGQRREALDQHDALGRLKES